MQNQNMENKEEEGGKDNRMFLKKKAPWEKNSEKHFQSCPNENNLTSGRERVRGA